MFGRDNKLRLGHLISAIDIRVDPACDRTSFLDYMAPEMLAINPDAALVVAQREQEAAAGPARGRNGRARNPERNPEFLAAMKAAEAGAEAGAGGDGVQPRSSAELMRTSNPQLQLPLQLLLRPEAGAAAPSPSPRPPAGRMQNPLASPRGQREGGAAVEEDVAAAWQPRPVGEARSPRVLSLSSSPRSPMLGGHADSSAAAPQQQVGGQVSESGVGPVRGARTTAGGRWRSLFSMVATGGAPEPAAMEVGAGRQSNPGNESQRAAMGGSQRGPPGGSQRGAPGGSQGGGRVSEGGGQGSTERVTGGGRWRSLFATTMSPKRAESSGLEAGSGAGPGRQSNPGYPLVPETHSSWEWQNSYNEKVDVWQVCGVCGGGRGGRGWAREGRGGGEAVFVIRVFWVIGGRG